MGYVIESTTIKTSTQSIFGKHDKGDTIFRLQGSNLDTIMSQIFYSAFTFCYGKRGKQIVD